MIQNSKIGIYFHLPTLSKNTVDYNELVQFYTAYPKKYSVFSSDKISYQSPELKSYLRTHLFSSILLVSEMPELMLLVFRKALNDLKLENVRLRSMKIPNYNYGHEMDTNAFHNEIRKNLESELGHQEALSRPFKLKSKATLIIGAGIAGIQAAIEIADSGNKVILLEKSGTIGGHMAMFDKTFPTLDCAACILTPKMAAVGHHPNIELLTLSEVVALKGEAGNFEVQVLKHPRRVNEKTCIGCGTCSEKCPGKAISEFDSGTTMRKSIYIPFPQAVPNKYMVDPDSCIYIQKGKCGVCKKVCPVAGCINLDEKPTRLKYHVGNVIVATGFELFDASQIKKLGYRTYPNVVTSIEFERLINSSGPTEGNIRIRTQDKKMNWIFNVKSPTPKSFAIIHCVGSRDENYHCYCSRVCCMYSLKLSHLIKEKIPDAKVFEHFIDMRAYGKGYEAFYERIKTEGIEFIRGKVGEIKQKDNKLVIRSEDIENEKLLEYPVDMVILSVGMTPPSLNGQLAKILGIEQDKDGWFLESHVLDQSFETDKAGIYLAGTCQGPKDIPDTVVHASSAASMVIQSILSHQIFRPVLDTTVFD